MTSLTVELFIRMEESNGEENQTCYGKRWYSGFRVWDSRFRV